MERRALLAGLGASLHPAASAAAATPGVVPGESVWSESAMVLAFDAELRNGLSFRLSRYPDRDRTWVWCHLLWDGRLYGFVTSQAPCAPRRVQAADPSGVYDTPGLRARIVRSGTSQAMQSLAFDFDVRAHAGGEGVEGAGPVRIRARGVFHPGPARTAFQAGRFERGGRIEALLGLGGREKRLSAPAKAHEQTQTAPRFTTPFTYAMLWGEAASLTGLLANGRGSGDLQRGDADVRITGLEIGPWRPERPLRLRLEDGGEIAGVALTRHRMTIPVFDSTWLGSIVQARVEGHDLVGMVNDWAPRPPG